MREMRKILFLVLLSFLSAIGLCSLIFFSSPHNFSETLNPKVVYLFFLALGLLVASSTTLLVYSLSLIWYKKFRKNTLTPRNMFVTALRRAVLISIGSTIGVVLRLYKIDSLLNTILFILILVLTESLFWSKKSL